MNESERCPGTNRNGEQCGHPEGWGTENESGPCKFHGGATPTSEENPDVGNGEQDENQNATTHSLHARKVNAVYQKVFSEDVQALVDSIYQDYLEDYRDRHGEPREGDKAELFRIAVSYGKHVHSEDWAIGKPDELESGNAMVDKETSYKTTQDGEVIPEKEYKQTVVQQGQQQLSQDRRMWLKDLGLLDTNPESQKAQAAEKALSEILSDD